MPLSAIFLVVFFVLYAVTGFGLYTVPAALMAVVALVVAIAIAANK